MKKTDMKGFGMELDAEGIYLIEKDVFGMGAEVRFKGFFHGFVCRTGR